MRAIVAPSNCHHLFVADAQRAFPGVPTYGAPGVAEKRPDLVLEPLPHGLWADEVDQVAIGGRVMREVVLYHRASRTVIAVDLVEHFRDETPGVDRVMRMWIKLMGMWNKPRPAPELRWMMRDRAGGQTLARTDPRVGLRSHGHRARRVVRTRRQGRAPRGVAARP